MDVTRMQAGGPSPVLKQKPPERQILRNFTMQNKTNEANAQAPVRQAKRVFL
jgi:hypothetical protein